MESFSHGLDQLCAAAACEHETCRQAVLERSEPLDVKMIEVEAFSSVQDLIHATILAGNGSAMLKH
ncbi:hypothetical protein H632_c3625p0, partial [Helicosporidium sp. ATCC 50920]